MCRPRVCGEFTRASLPFFLDQSVMVARYRSMTRTNSLCACRPSKIARGNPICSKVAGRLRRLQPRWACNVRSRCATLVDESNDRGDYCGHNRGLVGRTGSPSTLVGLPIRPTRSSAFLLTSTKWSTLAQRPTEKAKTSCKRAQGSDRRSEPAPTEDSPGSGAWL